MRGGSMDDTDGDNVLIGDLGGGRVPEGRSSLHGGEIKPREEYTPIKDLIDPSEILEIRERGGGGAGQQPERRLLVATLERALADLQLPSSESNAEAIRVEALEWFASSDPGNRTAFTFVYVCDTLGLNPDWIRSLIERRNLCRAPRAASMIDITEDEVTIPLGGVMLCGGTDWPLCD